jgi:UDP-N-acetyl-2-amino-2-deoxyglucuronate dehydrogenase
MHEQARQSKETSQMDAVGFTVIGLGMGRGRARQIQETEGATLVSVVDLNAARAEEVGDELNCKWTTKLAEALADDAVDVVVIFTPSGAHAEVAIEAFEAGKHVVTTKPMEVSLERCDAIIAAQQRGGKLLGVDFQERYSDRLQHVKYAIEHDLFGRLVLGEARLKWYRSQDYFDKGGWRGTWKLDGGGSLANQCVHQIDLLCWYMGKPKRVWAKTGIFNHQIETEDLGMAMIEFDSGALGTVLGTTTFPSDCYAGIEIHGTEGGVIAMRGEPEWHFRDEFADRKDVLQRVTAPRNLAEDFVSALRHGTPLICDGVEGRRATELLTAIYASAQQDGAVVSL